MKNVSVRLVNKSDAESILKIYASFVINTNIPPEKEVPFVSEFERRIEKITDLFPYLVCEIDGQAIGYSFVSLHDNDINKKWTTIYISDPYHRIKIGKALYTCIFELLKLQGFNNIQAIVKTSNEASLKFHASLGFEMVDRHSDTAILMEKKLSDNRFDPNETLSIKQLDSEVVTRLLKEAETLIISAFTEQI